MAQACLDFLDQDHDFTGHHFTVEVNVISMERNRHGPFAHTPPLLDRPCHSTSTRPPLLLMVLRVSHTDASNRIFLDERADGVVPNVNFVCVHDAEKHEAFTSAHAEAMWRKIKLSLARLNAHIVRLAEVPPRQSSGRIAGAVDAEVEVLLRPPHHQCPARESHEDHAVLVVIQVQALQLRLIYAVCVRFNGSLNPSSDVKWRWLDCHQLLNAPGRSTVDVLPRVWARPEGSYPK
mmetsp:Transcript_89339/g.163800  ORF Transcript_89339/g.163800 Transcript_89339/m.163800 type:complete len:235 (+) Transcript_89339:362-1066(+)